MSVRVRTADGPVDIPVRTLRGQTLGDLRAWLEKRYKDSVIRLVGQRVTPFEVWETVGALLKRTKTKTSSVALGVDARGGVWDAETYNSYELYAISERETPLSDNMELRHYADGTAKYRFEVIQPRALRKTEFEMNVMLYGEHRLQVMVSPDWTIRRIKAEVQTCTGIPSYNQRLFSKASAGDLLPDYKTIMDCGFGPKSYLDMTLAAMPRATPRKQPLDAVSLANIPRPLDVRVRLPPRGRVTVLKCDVNDSCLAVKVRLAMHLDPRRPGAARAARCSKAPAALQRALGEDVEEEEVDVESYLQAGLEALAAQLPYEAGELELMESLASLEEGEDDDETGLTVQELLAALRASQEQVRELRRELQACKERQARRSRRNSLSSIKSQ